MTYRKVDIDRGSFVGPLQTTSGTTYLRTQDISAVTQGQGVTMLHMTSGTIFTVREGRLWIVLERLGLDLTNEVTMADVSNGDFEYEPGDAIEDSMEVRDPFPSRPFVKESQYDE